MYEQCDIIVGKGDVVKETDLSNQASHSTRSLGAFLAPDFKRPRTPTALVRLMNEGSRYPSVTSTNDSMSSYFHLEINQKLPFCPKANSSGLIISVA